MRLSTSVIKNTIWEYSRLRLSRSLAVAAHYLHLVCRNGLLVVQLENNIFDKERPDFVTEAVGIEMTLCEEDECQLHETTIP